MTIVMIIVVAEQILLSTEQRDRDPAERKRGGRVEEEERKSGGREEGEWRKRGGREEGEWRKSVLSTGRLVGGRRQEALCLVIWLPLVMISGCFTID